MQASKFPFLFAGDFGKQRLLSGGSCLVSSTLQTLYMLSDIWNVSYIELY